MVQFYKHGTSPPPLLFLSLSPPSSLVQVLQRAQQPAASHDAGGSGQRRPPSDSGHVRECGARPDQRQELSYRVSCTVELQPQCTASLRHGGPPVLLLLIACYLCQCSASCSCDFCVYWSSPVIDNMLADHQSSKFRVM